MKTDYIIVEAKLVCEACGVEERIEEQLLLKRRGSVLKLTCSNCGETIFTLTRLREGK